MCGITGIFAFNEIGRFHLIHLSRANDAIAHRGPDAAKLFNDYYVGLAHRRLSIIDLSSAAHQPMTDPSGRFTIVFNGEIYNFQALRDQLEQAGAAFSTHSDTEVLLQAYIHWKEACLPKLHGFWAFAIYDSEEQSFFLARDRFGIKPLLYYSDEDKFLFASEMRALLAYNIAPEMDYTSFYQYLQLHYVPAPNTIFEEVHKLLPGHYMRVKKRDIQIHRYYQVPFPAPTSTPIPDYATAQRELLALLEEAVRERMISDVPLGAFLSGGIDSSTVVALASRFTDQLHTFSVGYANEPLFDETRYAEAVAKRYNTQHTVFKLTNDDLFRHLFDLLDLYGEPFADSSAIPFYMLSQHTRKKVTVALSGDGADEIFAGYHKYWGEMKAREKGLAASLLIGGLPVLDRLPKSRNTAWGNVFRRLHRFARTATLSPAERHWALSALLQESDLAQMLTTETLGKVAQDEYGHRKSQALSGFRNGQDFNEVLYTDLNLLLPNDMLHKVDSMSMAHALEVRVPFLDYRVVEFAFRLPAEYKINHQMKKRLLQDAVRPLLPKELYRRPKKGFDVPLAKGYQRELRSWIEHDVLADDFIRAQGVFRPAYIQQLKQRLFSGTNFDQHQVWGILAFQYWWKKFKK